MSSLGFFLIAQRNVLLSHSVLLVKRVEIFFYFQNWLFWKPLTGNIPTIEAFYNKIKISALPSDCLDSLIHPENLFFWRRRSGRSQSRILKNQTKNKEGVWLSCWQYFNKRGKAWPSTFFCSHRRRLSLSKNHLAFLPRWLKCNNVSSRHSISWLLSYLFSLI